MANNNKTDVNHVKQQNQKAEANKQFASGATNSMNAMDVEFGTETDVNHVKQQNQQSGAKQYASGVTNSMNAMDVEFGTETDVNHVKQQNQKAEANKKFASNNSNPNNSK